MAQLGVAGAGAVVGGIAGSFVGMPMLGAQIGWALGGVAGALLFPTKQPDQHGPRLSDLSVQTSGYGVPVAVVAGQAKIAGNVIWATEVEERETTRRQGKGGGGPKTVTYSYYQSWAVGLCEWLLPPSNAEVLRIWMDTILVYDTTGGSEVTQVPGLVWRFHGGSEAQLPDALIEAKLGVGHAPAHRGMAYVVFEDVPLDRFGNRMPNVTVELVADAARTFPEITSTAPASSIWSVPRFRDAKAGVAVDWARGRIYMGLRETGSDVLDGIRVLDLVTLTPITEALMSDIAEPLGLSAAAGSLGAAMLTMGQDGYLYASGAEVPYNWCPVLLKIDPDALRAVHSFGNGVFTFADGPAQHHGPDLRVHLQVPRLTGKPRNFMFSAHHVAAVPLLKIIDTDWMEFVWGTETNLDPELDVLYQFGGNGREFGACEGRRDPLTGTDLWFLNSSVDAGGGEGYLYVYRFEVSSGAGYLGGGATMGMRLTLVATILASTLEAGASQMRIKNVDYDAGDETLVVTVQATTNRVLKLARDGSLVWMSEAINATGNAANPAMGRSRMLGVNYGLPAFGLLALGNGQSVVNQAGTISGGYQHWTFDGLSDAVFISQEPGDVPKIKRIALNRLGAVDLSVADVVEALGERAGLAAADMNVSDIDLPLRGYVLARPMSARDAMTPLLAYVQADAAEVDDVLVFRRRGGAVDATIAYDDIVREDPSASVLEEQRAQDAELPREVSVRYLDIQRGWEQNAQTWRRPASPTRTMGGTASATMDLPIPLTADEAKTVARRMCIATWRERTKLTLAVLPRHLRLVPTDVVNVETRDGAMIRCRVLPANLGANWVTRLDLVTEDAAAYGLTATADSGAGWIEPTMPVPYYTRLIVPNLALVDDDDDLGQTGLREYAFACAYDGARWRGVTLFRSADYSAWTQIGGVTAPVGWGMVDVAAAAPASPWIWDEAASLVVSMMDGDLDSATALEVLNGANMAALVGSDGNAEIIQFRDATLGSDGRYTLTGLLRGRRGTEDQIAARSAGDAFILLDGTRFQFAAGSTEATATRFLRAVGLYETIDTAAITVTKAARGRAERPYAPARIAGSRDGFQNLTITWARRTRVGGEWLDGTGTVKLSEASEAYEVEIMNGGAVERTITGLTSATATYSSVDQYNDFGSVQAAVTVRVYQLSNIMGRGIAAEATV